MAIVSHVKLMTTIPYETAQRVVETWARSLQAEASDMYAKMLSRIPDANRFVERIAQPSHDGYASFVNPSFVSKGGQPESAIQDSQASNIKESYNKYREKLAYLFETVDGVEAKRFKDMVARMKASFGEGVAKRCLAFTGTRIEGRGLAPIAVLWLVNDLRVMDYLRAGDKVLEGGPYLVTRPSNMPSLKTALNGRLIQAGASIVKSDYAAGAISAHNDRTNQIIQGFVDPALGLEPFATGGLSHVDFIIEDGQLFLDVQVSRV